MKFIRNILPSFVALSVLASLSLSAFFGATAHAAQIPYDPNGTPTATTPIFNQFTGVPNGTGDESDFVRVKPHAGTNADYISTLNAACNDGDSYTVRTYIHNGASPDYNNSGAGTAVAHNVTVSLNAPVDTTNSNFTFASTVSATNATSVSDTGVLNCGGKNVKLTLVPSSVQTYSKTLGFQGAVDAAVNGSLRVGSRVQGSGDQWACWDDRIIVVYEVKVTVLPTPLPVTTTCDLLTLSASSDRKVTISQFNYTAKNATFKNVVIDWGDNTTDSTYTSDVVGQSHKFAKDGTYTVTATAHFTVNGSDVAITSESCKAPVTFTPNTPPVTPPVTPVTPVTPVAPTQPAPKKLVNTGAGSTIGMFALVSVAGAFAHNWFLNRRATR